MIVVALAGHVDHGKTALVRALTGTDTDRLPEERRRGMTLDLGFAYAGRPDGVLLGFVDVPGHERFFGTALSGLLNASAALLVVAADDGPMPQTLEHLDVLRLVGVPRIVAAVTKIDRVDAARQAEVAGALRALLDRAEYPDAEVLTVSAITGAGVAALRARLDALPPAPPAGGGFRLQVDRAFVLPGIGLVATGSVIAGEVAPGETLLLSPPRLAARVRGIEIAGRKAERAVAGDRAALAIVGPRLERARIGRGDWLLAPALHAPVSRLDAWLQAPSGLRHGTGVLIHLGAAEAPGRVLLPGGADMAPGTAGFAHLLLHRPLGALYGDRLILRAAGTGRLAAGGRVIAPFPPPRREPPARRGARLAAQGEADPALALPALLAVEGAVDLAAFTLTRNLGGGVAETIARRSGALVRGTAALALSAHEALRTRIADALARRHAEHPDRIGPPKPALLAAAALGQPRPIAEAVLAEMLAEGAVVQEGAALRLPDHRPALRPEDAAQWDRLAPLLEAAGLRPPRVRELAEMLGLEVEATDALLVRLEHFGLLARVAPNRLFPPQAIEALAGIAHELAAASPEASFTAAEFNTRAGIGRNLTIQVLEALDRQGITHRIGDARCVVTSSPMP